MPAGCNRLGPEACCPPGEVYVDVKITEFTEEVAWARCMRQDPCPAPSPDCPEASPIDYNKIRRDPADGTCSYAID